MLRFSAFFFLELRSSNYAPAEMANENIICANELRKGEHDFAACSLCSIFLAGHYIEVDQKLARVKEISRSKTGKHGSCKLTLKCCNVFKQNKTIMHMTNSQDDLAVFTPPQESWELRAADVREGTAEFKRGDETITLALDRETLVTLQESLDEREAMECTVLSWRGKHTLLRVAKQKAPKASGKGRR
jgi:translation elongation factor P/translation initiation factor 5A